MGQVATFLSDTLGANERFVDSIAHAEALIDKVSKYAPVAGQAYAAVKDTLNLLGLLDQQSSGPSELSRAVDRLIDVIMAQVDKLVAKVAAAEWMDRWFELVNLRGDARTELNLLRTPMPAGTPPPDPRLFTAAASALERLTFGAGDTPYWLRMNADSNSQALAVFEYRLALPIYLEVIGLRLLVSGLLGIRHEDHQPPWSAVADDLQRLHDHIVAGIKFSDGTPPPYELADLHRCPFGARDTATGLAMSGHYPLADGVADGAWQLPAIVSKRIAVLGLKASKDLYAAIGLPAVRDTIDHLRKLSGSPPSPQNPHTAWSLREVGQLRVRIGVGTPSGAEDHYFPLLTTKTPISLRTVADALELPPDAVSMTALHRFTVP